MKIQPLGYNSVNNNVQRNQLSNVNYMQKNMTDVFVKNTNNISFTGETNKTSKKDILEGILAAGVVGGAFAATVGAAIHFIKNPGDDVFLYDGTYFMNTKEMSLKSENVIADGDDGILKIKGTGIDIHPDRFDIVDPENGIYKNFDGSADIDLLHNKFIDKANGIFIDPEHNVSAILNNDKWENIVVPNFGSGYPTMPHDPRMAENISYYIQNLSTIRRAEFIEKYGMTPEEYQVDHDISRTILPDDTRSTLDKMKDFFNGHNSQHDKTFDIFGREIITVENNGTISHFAIDEKLAGVMDKYHLDEHSVSELSQFVDNLRLKEYLVDCQPDFSHIGAFAHVSIEDFLDGLSKHEIGDVVKEILPEMHSGDGSIWNDFKEALGL